MSIAPGRRLGPYEIVQLIGTGGMGEVYRANDTRLDRTVAIKVLPDHLSNDVARCERFEREARAVSSLNHPQICTLYDVGEHDGVHFLVMEFIDGETLADRLSRGALPLHQALDDSAKIAEALDKAHRAGIVHRDLKPGNIMLTKMGVKLLDFGLAKLRDDGAVSSDSEQPTRQKPLTDAGTIMGTVQYMSPEQLEGKEVDARADIWSFGAVLYEMLTGRKAFEGSSQASLITAIMSVEPQPVSERQPLSPRGLDRIVKKCLAKDSEDRWHSAHDLADELKWVSNDATEPGTHAARRTVVPWVVAAVTLIAAAIGAWVTSRNVAAPPTPVRFAVTIPPEQRLAADDTIAVSLALSPSGQQLAYVAREGGSSRIYLRRTDAFEAEPLPGTERGERPFFSPDGAWLGFHRDRQLQKLSLSGGAPVTICDVPEVWFWPTWGADGTIVFSRGTRSGLSRVHADGGPPEALTVPDPERGEQAHEWPQFLPDGERLLFTVQTDSEGSRLAVLSLATGEWEHIDALGDAETARYIASPTGDEPGRLIFWSSGTLTTQLFDAARLEPIGPTSALDDAFAIESAVHYAVSDNGSLAYVPGLPVRRHPVKVTRNGVREGAPLDVVTAHPTLSPDGGRLALDWNNDIWILDLSRGTRLRLTTGGGRSTPIWSPDGSSVVYRHRTRTHDLVRKRADGSGDEELLHANEHGLFITSWSPDGTTIAFEEENPASGRDLMLLSLADGATAKPFLRSPYTEAGLRFSPDGALVAYVSDETGSGQIYVRRYPGEGAPLPISSAGGAEPTWSPKGDELFYRNGDEVLAVTFTTEPTLAASTPRLLFTSPYFFGVSTDHAHYDVFPDGESFIMLTTTEDEAVPSQINVVLNWTAELEQLPSPK